MATLDELKRALRRDAARLKLRLDEPLLDSEYEAGFQITRRGSNTYHDFIIPRLAELLESLAGPRDDGLSVLEVGPGPRSVLGGLPGDLRRKIKSYTAVEPNLIHSESLRSWIARPVEEETLPVLPSLEDPPTVLEQDFATHHAIAAAAAAGDNSGQHKGFNLVIFCHSMYGMNDRRRAVGQALELLVRPAEAVGMVVVFHRDGDLTHELGGLVSVRTATFPDGSVLVRDENDVLSRFAPFIAGLVTSRRYDEDALPDKWLETCREMAIRPPGSRNLLFGAPDIMLTFTRAAASLQELQAQVSGAPRDVANIKNREARRHLPASIVRPVDVTELQSCVGWAIRHGLGLTVLGGGHSGHCLWPCTVAVDMSAFDNIRVVPASPRESEPLVVVGAGCKTEDIVETCLAKGFAVPLGTRPSVGAGLWLQGGIGHLSRLRGLTCDAIVGVVVVSVATGDIHCAGKVPSEIRHNNAVPLGEEEENDLLWAVKGAGTNFGIVVSVVFGTAPPSTTCTIRSWVLPLSNGPAAKRTVEEFDALVSRGLPRNLSADAYLYYEDDRPQLGVSLFENSSPDTTASAAKLPDLLKLLGHEAQPAAVVDAKGLFEADLHMSQMHGGHKSGKTSSFKRCIFLKNIRQPTILGTLLSALSARPTPRCYFHLLQGGGAVLDYSNAEASAFRCRDWDFACVLTGIWPRGKDETATSRAVTSWVYETAYKLLPRCVGVYSADLGPDPRDYELAGKAFGRNLQRLIHVKKTLDPHDVLRYGCPLKPPPSHPGLIILVTGESCSGKDHSANSWAAALRERELPLDVQVSSISDAIKREYSDLMDAELPQLLQNRAYKEQHRQALTRLFRDRVQQNPRLPQQSFLQVATSAAGKDVLFITGMRDEAPVTEYAHLVPDSRLIEVRVTASRETRRSRRGYVGRIPAEEHGRRGADAPNLIFTNDAAGSSGAVRFCAERLSPLVHPDLQRLSGMVPCVPDFPAPSIDFRHILNIAQTPDGLPLSTSLLKRSFHGDWSTVDAIVCCETGGFVFASPLAEQLKIPLVLVREAGKLPPPIISVAKESSHISSSSAPCQTRVIGMSQGVIQAGASVVIVDDVFATGHTLCAVVDLLSKAGVRGMNISVMVVAEFPAHRGRSLLRRGGHGGVRVQNLMVFGGM